MKYNHRLNCNAAICQDDVIPDYKNEVPWYPGEEVCTKEPYTEFQRKQSVINREVKKGTFRKLDEPYTAFELETRSI